MAGHDGVEMIYLDNAATTRPFEEINDIIELYNTKLFFNPSASYKHAVNLSREISSSRLQLAKCLGFNPDEIIFTSGATEANNLAIKGTYKQKTSNIVTTEGEHESVYKTVHSLKAYGAEIRVAGLSKDGSVKEDQLVKLVDENTTLVSVIHVSNETGAVNDIQGLAARVKKKNANTLFHSDGAQAFCKLPFTPLKNIDIYSISGHKIGAPKGIGALASKKTVNLNPQMLGGTHENGMRAGTLNVAGIMALAAASLLYPAKNQPSHILNLKHRLLERLQYVPEIQINSAASCVPNIVSISIRDMKAEVISNLLAQDDILVGLGSACSSKNSDHRVLNAMGVKKDWIDGTLRISFSGDIELEDIDEAVKRILDYVVYLKQNKNIGVY